MKIQKFLEDNRLTVLVEMSTRLFSSDDKNFYYTKDLIRDLKKEGYVVEKILKEPKLGYITNFKTHSDLVTQAAMWVFEIERPEQQKTKQAAKKPSRPSQKKNLQNKSVRDRISNIKKKRANTSARNKED